MTVRWTVRAADRNRRNDLSAKLTEGLSQWVSGSSIKTNANPNLSRSLHPIEYPAVCIEKGRSYRVFCYKVIQFSASQQVKILPSLSTLKISSPSLLS